MAEDEDLHVFHYPFLPSPSESVKTYRFGKVSSSLTASVSLADVSRGKRSARHNGSKTLSNRPPG